MSSLGCKMVQLRNPGKKKPLMQFSKPKIKKKEMRESRLMQKNGRKVVFREQV